MQPESMDEIYSMYYKELYLYALSLSRDDSMAKDLVSETFYKALIASNHPPVKDISFKYWLFRVLKNHLIDHKRKKIETLTLEQYTPFISESSTFEPANQYIKNERNQRLYQYFICLEPIIYREVIYMYYFAGMSIKEIATNINLTHNNTKTILYRARKKLGKQLKEDTYEF